LLPPPRKLKIKNKKYRRLDTGLDDEIPKGNSATFISFSGTDCRGGVAAKKNPKKKLMM